MFIEHFKFQEKSYEMNFSIDDEHISNFFFVDENVKFREKKKYAMNFSIGEISFQECLVTSISNFRTKNYEMARL